ncbi:hypothetical protein [Petroclostridium xylanilyticum]|jgi:PAS domain-containing protein|uniref:hypothetical protein n=1 Tax=Petroclostridium xylanilyticum TaxID=1792311 RepID=UPI0018E38FA6|nr:hypothetical protein [Petroclostridium xylanilyticum]
MQEVLQQAPFGYAYHKILFNEQGEAVDYIFLDTNSAFEEMTGLKRETILGKTYSLNIPVLNFKKIAV